MTILRGVAKRLPLALVALASGVTCGQSPSTGSGQAYPSKPLRLLTAEAGGGSDLVARVVAQALAPGLAQQVIVDNRGIVAAEIVAKAPADGYTLLSYGSPFWISPLMQKTPYDTVKDFSPVALTANSPNVLVVHPTVAATSVRELIALARAKAGELNYASSTTGSTPHLAGELFNTMAGVNIIRINYKGNGPAFIDLLAGRVQIMIPSIGSVTPLVKAGKLRALAVASAQPSELAPGLPTVAASGLPGYEVVSPFAIFAPAKTPAAIINRLNQEIVRAVNRPDVKERFFSSGVETAGGSPDHAAAAISADMAKWSKVIKDAGIRAE